MMPAPGQKAAPALTVVQRAHLPGLAAPEATLGEVLAAVHALAAKVDRVEAALAPRRSPLTIDPDEISRTMAQLQTARPITRRTPP